MDNQEWFRRAIVEMQAGEVPPHFDEGIQPPVASMKKPEWKVRPNPLLPGITDPNLRSEVRPTFAPSGLGGSARCLLGAVPSTVGKMSPLSWGLGEVGKNVESASHFPLSPSVSNSPPSSSPIVR